MSQPTIWQGTLQRGTVLGPGGSRADPRPAGVAAHHATVAERILFVSDDEQLRSLFCELLVAQGYADALGFDYAGVLASCERFASCAVAILDSSGSYADAVRVFRKLKKSGGVPIVVIAAKGYAFDNTELAMKGDVLLAKPFDPRELMLVIRGMLQGRVPAAPQSRESLSVGPVTLHLLLNTVTVAAREIDLTGAETRVLEELLVNASKPVHRDRLMHRALGREWSPFDRCLDSHIKRLRRKIGEDRRGRTPIRTVRGIGYLVLAEWEPRA